MLATEQRLSGYSESLPQDLFERLGLVSCVVVVDYFQLAEDRNFVQFSGGESCITEPFKVSNTSLG